MVRRGWGLTAAAGLVLATSAVHAHHSFAVFFDPSREISITGQVTAFRFTNPHGLVVLNATDAQGRVREWRAETNAPAVLVRRGWTRDAIKPGETVTIQGWPSRDGKPYIRLRRALRVDGRLVGTAPFGSQDQS